jgi:hypothetical protein
VEQLTLLLAARPGAGLLLLARKRADSAVHAAARAYEVTGQGTPPARAGADRLGGGLSLDAVAARRVRTQAGAAVSCDDVADEVAIGVAPDRMEGEQRQRQWGGM